MPAQPSSSRNRRFSGSALLDRRLQRAASRLIGLGLVTITALAALVWQNSAQATDTVDRRVAAALYALPGSTVRLLFGAITVAGEPAVVIVLTLIVAAWTWRRLHDRVLAAFCPIAVAAASVVEEVLKTVVGRSRPATALLAHETSRSFPSGHATAGAALATTLTLLILATRPPRRRLLFALLAAYSLAISASRLVLGVHFLTDVIAGSAIGVAVPIAVALAVSGSQQRREADSDDATSPAARR